MSKTYVNKMEITSVYFSYYEPSKHGVVIKISGKIDRNNDLKYDIIKMNLHGKFWSALPMGVDKIIKWTYMPLSLKSTYWKSVEIDKTACPKSVFNGFTIILHFGTKEGQFGISHETLFRELKKMSISNKSVLEIEFQCQKDWKSEIKPFFSIFTTIPLIFHSMVENKDALFDGPIPPDIRSVSILSECYEYFRWGFWPVFFLLFLIISCSNPSFFADYMPKLFFNEKLNTKIVEKLAPCPETLSQSWQVSRLEYEYGLIESQILDRNLTRMNEILADIAMILGRSFIDRSEVHLIYQEIINKEHDIGLGTRVKGIFNFINLIWLLAIVGISISVGPCLYTILKPLRTAIWEVALQIWHYVIIPMHSNGIIEIMFYLLCMNFVTEGLRYASESGFYITLTGLFCSFAANAYTFFLRSKIKPNDGIYILYNLLFSLYMIPLAIYFQSNLLGWLAVLCFYQAIGFSFICAGLCYYIGFKDDEAMMRVSITSTIIGLMFIGLKAWNLSNYYVDPFATPLTVSSALVLLLALLIFSSYYYHGCGKFTWGEYYMSRQIPMITFLIVFLLFGNMFHMVGLVNTATVYLVFYLMEKYCDLHCTNNWNGWVLIFIFSVIIYKGALYPEILFSMFNYNQ